MIRITDLEQKLVVEQIFGESCGELYTPETFSEWESFESHKQEIYETLWNSEQTFWDIYEMGQRGLFTEASPTAFSDTPTTDVPDVARKQVTISKQMAYLGLPQVPPQAAAGFLANNMVSSNPDYYRYIGKGFFGALQDRHNGKEPSNWVKEIRYILQGKPNALVIDRETMKPVPRMGAVTNRNPKEGVPQIPPAWNDYAPRKANAFQDEETGQPYHGVYIGYGDHIKQLETKIGQKVQLTPGGNKTIKGDGKVHPITRIIRDEKGNPVMGPDGKPKTKVIGYVDRRKDQTVSTKGAGMDSSRGQIGADLRPPVLDKEADPDGSSYLGSPADPDNDIPALPPGARGYKPQSLSSSNALQRQWGQYKWYMMQNPQLFDRRLIRVLMAKQQKDRAAYNRSQKIGQPYTRQFTPERKGRIPTDVVPIQRNVVRTTPYDNKPDGYGVARQYDPVDVTDKTGKTKSVIQGVPQGHFRRMWHPDPNMPARKLLASPEKRDMTPEERQSLAAEFGKRAQKVHEEISELDQQISAIKKQAKLQGQDYTQNPEWKALTAQRAKKASLFDIYLKKVGDYERGTMTVPRPTQTGRFGNQRTAYTPEEEEEIRKKGTLNGKAVTAKSRDRFVKRGKLVRDENGKLIQMPTTGTVRKTVLPNNYFLTPAQGDPIVVSDNLRQLASQMGQAQDKAQRKEFQTQLMRAANSGKPDDKVFAKYCMQYGLKIDKNGNIKATNPKMVSGKAMDIPWTWARTDEKGEIFYIYSKDQKQRDIPVYLPGVIDSRKPGNSTAAGGWDAAPSNAPEVRPYRDGRQDRATHGYTEPSTGKTIAGWKMQMVQASEKGVQAGLAELLQKKFSKQVDQFGNTGKEHKMYQDLMDAQGDIANSAYIYFQYNMANSKALDFRQNNTGRIDVQYVKRTFPHLYAACKQFDQWLDQKEDGKTPNRKFVQMRPGSSIFDLTFPDLAKVINLLGDHTRTTNDDGEEDYDRLFQTKINTNYIKHKLKDYVATDYVKPALKGGEIDPNPPKDRSHYNASGKRVNYNYINVGYKSLIHMFDEARRNYWEFAAKDMVIKMWQHMNTAGGNVSGLYGDSIDSARSGQSGAGGKRRKGQGTATNDVDAGDSGAQDGGPEGEEGGTGPTRTRLVGDGAPESGKGHQIIGRKTPAELWDYAHKYRQKINQIAQELKSSSDNGGIENAAQQLALIPAAKRNAIEIDVMAELNAEIEKKGQNLDDKAVEQWFMSEFEKRVKDRMLNKQKTGDKRQDINPVNMPAERTPEEYIKNAPQEGLDNQNQMWGAYASHILKVKPMELEELMNDFNEKLEAIPDRKSKEMAERTVTYHVLKSVLEKAPTMTSSDKRRLMTVATSITSDYKALYDLGDLLIKALANVPDEAPGAAPVAPTGNAAAPAAGGGLRGRLGRKTGTA
jgi:hypothetical protein